MAQPGSPETVRALLERASRHLAGRQIGKAVMAWVEALQRDPNNPVILYYLGHASLLSQRFTQAIGLLQRALDLQPDLAPAHYAMGLALQSIGHDGAAITAYRRAIAVSPELAEAHARLGVLLNGTSDQAAAVASFRRAAAAAPDTTIGRLALAKALIAEYRYEQAEAVLRASLTHDPENADTCKVLGDVLLSGGRLEEAEAAYRRAVVTAGEPAAAYHGLVTARKLTEADRPLVATMHSVLHGAPLSLLPRMIMHFALGKALDDLGDYAAAMQHFDAANALRRQTHRLDRTALAGYFDQTIARFTPAFFAAHAGFGDAAHAGPGDAAHAGFGDPSALPLLVLGMPRSGTTLTEQILSSHRLIAGGGEIAFWAEHGSIWETGEANAASSGRIIGNYLRRLRNVSGTAERVIDKTPMNFIWIGLIHLLFPNARIIHCKRDPIDTCLSLYSTYFTTRMDFAADRDDLVFFYQQYQRLMAHWKSVLPADRLFEIQYEELVADREQRSRDLLAFCGVDWDEACLVPERNRRPVRTASLWQVRQPVYQTPTPRRRRYEPWLGTLRLLSRDATMPQDEAPHVVTVLQDAVFTSI
jgi:tetratricopeptide (TPR) repeat protein